MNPQENSHQHLISWCFGSNFKLCQIYQGCDAKEENTTIIWDSEVDRECNAILQKNLLQKLKDPWGFTITCVTGGSHVNRALCCFGASINVMCFSIYRSLELGEVNSSTINLQFADRPLAYLRGIVEDVLVKVYKFIFLADFMILDM